MPTSIFVRKRYLMSNQDGSFNNIPPESNELLEESNLRNNILKRFLLMMTIFTLVSLGLGYYIYQQYTHSLEEKLLAQEEAFVATTTYSLQKEMQVQLIALQMTSKSKVLSEYLINHSEQSKVSLESKESLEGLFKNLTVAFQHYDQVRLFDLDGDEMIRINYNHGNPSSTDQSNLQNKHNRYYFQQALSMKPNETYVSKMDLNIENEKIEVPYNPTLRFATQVLDDNGDAVGVLILNYLANDLLENFRHQMTLRINGQGMLIDEQGYWLSNHDRSNEWGMSLGHPENHFKKRYPTAWPIISKSNNGTLKTENGLFRYQAITPLDFSSIESPNKQTDNHAHFPITMESIHNTNWKLVIFLPNEIIQQYSFFYKQSGRLLIALLYFSIAFIMLLLITNSEQKKLRKKNHIRISSELKDLYENAPCGYHTLNPQGVVTRINKTELNWLGYEREEVIGQSFAKFLTPASQDTFETFLTALPKKQEMDGIVLEVQPKQGETFFVSTSAVVLLNEGNFALARTSAFNITDRIELEKRLEYIANTDVLTGISNRRHFFEQVTPLFNQCQDTQTPLTLLMIDVDHFKSVNDIYGHDAGDLVLQHLSHTIKESIHESMLFARLGGEEFVVVAQCNQDEGLILAEQIRSIISLSHIHITEDTQVTITLSIGVAVNHPQHTDIDDILKQADLALYEAKQTGRNRVLAFNEAMKQANHDDYE